LDADTPEILIIQQLSKLIPSAKVLQKTYKNVSILNILVSPDPLSLALSTTLATNTPDPQTYRPSAFLVETKGISETTGRTPDALERGGEGDIQNVYSCDLFCSPNTGATTTIYLYGLRSV
jgi:hypothetical protein